MGKTIWQGLSQLYSARPEENFEGFLLKKRWFFISFCNFSKIIVHFCQTFTAGFPKLQSICPEKNCERDKIWKNDEFLVILYFQWKKLDSGQSNWASGCQNYLRHVQRNIERIFCWKKDDFSYFLHLEQNYCCLLPNIYGRVSEISIYVYGEKFWEKKKWQKYDFLVILYFELKILDFGQNNLAGVVKAASGVSRGTFWAFFLWKKQWFLNDFCTLSKKVPYFAKTLRQGFRNFNLRVRRRILREKKWIKRWFLSNFVLWVENIGLWAKQFGKGYQSFIRRVQRNLLSIFIEKTMIFEWNLYFEQKSSGLSQNFTAGFPKLQDTSLEKNFEREKLWKNDDFLVILYFEIKKNWTLGKRIWQRLSNLYSVRLEENCEGFSLKKRWFFISFCTFSKIIVDFCQTFKVGYPKLQSICPEKNCERKKSDKKMIS